jgi:hypothetical protein
MAFELVNVFNALIIGYQNSYNKPMQLVIVSAVPFISAGAFSAIKVDSRVSHNHIPKRRKKSNKKVC